MFDNLLIFAERQTEKSKIFISQNSWNLNRDSKGVPAEGKCLSLGPHKRDIPHHQSEKLLCLLFRNSESGLFFSQKVAIFYFSQYKLIDLTT
jgi:hypothetical protein